MQIIGAVKKQPKMNSFVSNRDIIIRSAKSGMAIRFVKDVPIQVPRSMQEEVMEKGIVPVAVDENAVSADQLPKEPKPLLLAPEDAGEREDAILEVVNAIVQDNNPANFTGAGCPSAKAVSMALGWHVDQTDVRRVWEKHRVAIKGEDLTSTPKQAKVAKKQPTVKEIA